MKILKKSLINLGSSHKDLRPHLREIISFLEKRSATKIVIRGSQRDEYKQEAFDIIKRTYASIGVPVKKPEDLYKYPVWWVYEDQDENVVAFSAFKETKYGLKAGLSGFDGGSEGKSIAVNTIRTKFLEKGIYGEVSHKVKDIALAAGAPKVPVEYVPEILGKTIEPTGEYSYIRSITGVGPVEKVMIGKPKINFSSRDSSWNNFVRSVNEGHTLTSSDDECDLHAHLFCSLLP